MTGDILRRLREAYGLERKDVAEALGKSCYAVLMLERSGRSWSYARSRGTRFRDGADRQTRFGLYLDALRVLRGKRAHKPQFVFCPPPGATHQIERHGIKEWARIVPCTAPCAVSSGGAANGDARHGWKAATSFRPRCCPPVCRRGGTRCVPLPVAWTSITKR